MIKEIILQIINLSDNLCKRQGMQIIPITMTTLEQRKSIIEDIQHNCNISDAKDHGVYSMCTMVLKLRNLYKWEHNIEPWEEPEPAELLDWIEAKENYWESIADESYRPLGFNGKKHSPINSEEINPLFNNTQFVYGAGYGRSMKAVFFLAELIEKRTISGCPVVVLGKERAKEMASPFAMSQDGVIYVRKESLRFFLWDQIQELRSSCRTSFRHALQLYGLLKNDQLDQQRFKEKLDIIVEEEMDLFIYHEVGEIRETTLATTTQQTIIARFPSSVVELVCRSVKDILADTHPEGLLSYVIREQKESSLSFYIGFLDGLRKELFPEIFDAWQLFLNDKNWQHIEQARTQCREKNMRRAGVIKEISQKIGLEPDENIQDLFNKKLILPMGLDIPQQR